MANQIRLYVYRINEREYGAGLGLEECKRRGEIVERWPLYTPEQAKFLATHGTSYGNATHLVTRMANLIHELMVLDPTFRPEPDIETEPTPNQAGTEKRPTLFQRILSWCFAR